MRLAGRAGMAALVASGALALAAPASAAGPPPAFHPYNAHAVGSWPEAVAIGDLTGDGLADVLMSTSFYFDEAADYRLWLFPQQSDGTLGAPTPLLTGASYGDDMSLEIADLDGDGDLDAAVTTSAGVELFAQDAGTLAYSWTVPATSARLVEAVDVSGDGLADLVVSTSDGVRAFRQINGDFMTFGTVTTEAQTDLEVADVTGDGVADVVGLSGATVSVYRNAGGGVFDAPLRHATGGTSPWDRGNGLAAGDLNGDGRTDVAVTIGGNSPNSKVGILTQQADGVLLPSITRDSYDIPETAEAADVNADGLTDLVVLHGGWNRAGVYLQQDDGSLSGEDLYAIPYASHYNVDGLAVGDITSDGRADLALADYNNGLVTLRSAGEGADVTPPNTAITSGPSGTHRSRDASFTFSSTEPGTFECRLDSAPFAPCTTPASYTGLASGSHTFTVRAIDTAANADPTPAVRSFTVDGPDTTISAGPSGTVRSTSATFSFTGSPTPAGFECSLGGAAFAPCTSPVTYSNLATGSSQTFRVRAVSADGLVDGTPATRTWSIESAADLSLTLSATPEPVKPKGTLTYTLRVTNTGPATAANVSATLGLPSGLTLQSVSATGGSCTSSGNPATIRCTAASLTAGASMTVTVVTKVTAANNSVLTATAVASTTTWDPDSTDDAGSVTTRVRSGK